MPVVSLDTRRREKIGGSEAASACGIDPYRSRLMLWYEKVNGVERDETEAMRLGTLLQPAVAEIAGERGYEIMPAPDDGFTHPRLPWMVCHPDGFASVDGERGIAEIKTRGTGWNDEDELALAGYVMQVQHGMEVCGLDVGLLAILHGGHGGLRLELREVERDDKLISRMVELEQEIVDAVRTETPPKPRGTKSDTEAITAMYPETKRPTMRLSAAGYDAVKELRARKEQRKVIEQQEDELEQRIKMEMGGAWAAISPYDENVAEWGMVDGHRFDTKRFRADHPEFDLDYYMTRRTRRFLLK